MSSSNPFPGARPILSVSRDPMLLASRNAVLRSAGYSVETTMRDDHALDAVRAGGIAAVVLGDSIDCHERDDLARAIHQIAPGLPVLVIKLTGEEAPPDATASMDSLDGPEVLLEILRQLLSSREAQAA